jgi:hypothetical protein
VLTVDGVDTKCKPPQTGVSNICASLAPALPWLPVSLSFRLEKSCATRPSRWGPSASAELSTDIRSVDDICEQRLATSTRYGSDSSLKPVTSGRPPRTSRSFLNCKCFEPAPRPVPDYLAAAHVSLRWALCSRVNRRESALPNARRQLIFAALTSYPSEPVSTATRAAVIALKTSGNWKT